jgi:hypothetical protein
MAKSVDQLTGVLSGVRWRSSEPGSHFCIASLESGETVKGDGPIDEFIPGLTYRFFGRWSESHPKYGKSFQFTAFSRAEPHSRRGMVKYLERYAPNVGPVIAGRLFDTYNSDACKILRTDPVRVANEIKGMTRDKAREAAEALSAVSELEDVKIDLANLLAGRGFSGAMVQQVIRKFGPLAPARIKRDPFTLLVNEFPGCGFARCDRLYMDLGLPPGRLKRQMICIWHALKSSNDGHTWFTVAWANARLEELVSGVRVDLRRAVRLGIRAGWLALKIDAAGRYWIADGKKAANEQLIADRIKLLIQGPPTLPRFTEAIEGECDRSDEFSCPKCQGAEYIEVPIEGTGGEVSHIPCDQCGTTLAGVGELDVEGLLKIGRETGICQFCGRRLVHPISVAIGIGPRCAERVGIPWEVQGFEESGVKVEEASHEVAMA